MRALFYILNDSDKLNELIDKLQERDIKGGTIFDTNGMGREYARRDGFKSMLGSLRMLVNPELKDTKTMMFVLEESKVKTVISIIEEVVGSLDEPGSGIAFTFSVDFVKGLKL